MKIVIAPDSFKESLTAKQVASTIARAWRGHHPDAEIIEVPMADGGEGTTQSLIDALGGSWIERSVSGPLGHPVAARYGMVDDLAIIEMAEASGLHRVPPAQRNPMVTCSRGTGELMVDALDRGANKIILGLGGSATNDAGVGMLKALGVRFSGDNGWPLSPGGGGLGALTDIDISQLHPRLEQVEIVLACDVDNPLTGKRGASAVFGPQKGASPEQVEVLDHALGHFAECVERQLSVSVAQRSGAGAAGGMGAALLAFTNAKLRPGVALVGDTLNLAEHCQGADLVITGEGRMDGQSIAGKTPVGVAKIAKAAGVKRVIAIAGSLGADVAEVYGYGIDAVFDCVDAIEPLEVVLANAEHKLWRVSDALARFSQ